MARNMYTIHSVTKRKRKKERKKDKKRKDNSTCNGEPFSTEDLGAHRQAVDHRHVSGSWRIQIDAVCRMIVIHIMHHVDLTHSLTALSPGMSWVSHVMRHVMHHVDMPYSLTALSLGMSSVIHIMRHVMHHVDMSHGLTALSPGMSWVAVSCHGWLLHSSAVSCRKTVF